MSWFDPGIFRELRSCPTEFSYIVFLNAFWFKTECCFSTDGAFSVCHLLVFFHIFCVKRIRLLCPLVVLGGFSLGLWCYSCYYSFLETFLFVVLWNAQTAYLHQSDLSGIVCLSRSTYQWWKNIACQRAVISDKRTPAKQEKKGIFYNDSLRYWGVCLVFVILGAWCNFYWNSDFRRMVRGFRVCEEIENWVAF